MNHYTYMLTVKNPADTRRLYIGVRSCKVQPEQDVRYFGSCRPMKAWMKTQEEGCVEKIILARWPSRAEALEHEIFLHECFDVGVNPEFWNRAKQRATGFDTSGTVGWSRGTKLSPERAAFMRTLAKGNTNRRGKKHTEEAKRKNSLAHMGNAYHKMPHSEETKRKIQAANKGRRTSIATEFKPGMKTWNKGVSPSLETREKISASLKRYNAKDKAL